MISVKVLRFFLSHHFPSGIDTLVGMVLECTPGVETYAPACTAIDPIHFGHCPAPAVDPVHDGPAGGIWQEGG